MGNNSMRQCLEVNFFPKNEYHPLSEKIDRYELGDAIFQAYLKYYQMIKKK